MRGMLGEMGRLIWERREKRRVGSKDRVIGKTLKGGQEMGRKWNKGQKDMGRKTKEKLRGKGKGWK